MIIVREKRYGQRSCFIFKCKMCNVREMDADRGAVCGTTSTGGGRAQLEEMTSAMNIPTTSAKTFRRYHDDVCDGWEATALNEMKLAAEEEEEARLDVAAGDVDVNGVPVTTVIADVHTGPT
ncbi:hypothetical protein PR048_027959 [Dryococelus australis]|uniref:Mutator-like transposase domain-containing protein n=1 Tax=Dryococelus australis TaxID=614101 RepID=A0ABQ9GI11_9NEOP|nr:hypothetical protein PR048_027959 [Dryococelus australis]